MELYLVKNLINLEKIISIYPKESPDEKYPSIHYNVKEFCDKLMKGKFSNKIAFVYGTSRHETRSLHPTPISDALYIPEIITNLRILYRKRFRKDLIFKSVLDVDVTEEMKENWNIITTGDGEVNLISYEMLNEYQYQKWLEYPNPKSPIFDRIDSDILEISEDEARFRYHNRGAIILAKNPWSKMERFIIYLAGIGPIGTVASLNFFNEILLKEKLRNSTSNYCEMVVDGVKEEYNGIYQNYKNFCQQCFLIKYENSYYYEGELSNVKRVAFKAGITKNGEIFKKTRHDK